MSDRYFARSASDKKEDWPFWFVADRAKGNLNVTGAVARDLGIEWTPGAVFTNKEGAKHLADEANKKAVS